VAVEFQKSQSNRTDQVSSEISIACSICLAVFPSQSHRTDQVSSEQPEGRPDESEQSLSRNPTVPIRSVPSATDQARQGPTQKSQTPYRSGQFRGQRSGARLGCGSQGRNPTVPIRSVPSSMNSARSQTGTSAASSRNPTVPIRSVPTPCTWAGNPSRWSSRNPAVPIRSVPHICRQHFQTTWMFDSRLSWRSTMRPSSRSRNPTVPIRSVPTASRWCRSATSPTSSRNPAVPIRSVPTNTRSPDSTTPKRSSQSHRTDQVSSEVRGGSRWTSQAIPSQSHRTDQVSSE
jgi:hypothetical protein